MARFCALIAVRDERTSDRLRRLLASSEVDVEVSGEVASGGKAAAALGVRPADVVFLDVDLPDLDSLSEAIGGDRTPAVVLVTGFDQATLRAFELHGLNYLLTPLDRAHFQAALTRARMELAAPGGAGWPPVFALLKRLGTYRRPLERLAVRSGQRVVFVRAERVDWIDTVGNYARLHVGGEVHRLRARLQDLETQLAPDRFVRIHRSTIVNVDRIAALHSAGHGEKVVVLADGTRLGSSRTYSDRLGHLLGRAPRRRRARAPRAAKALNLGNLEL